MENGWHYANARDASLRSLEGWEQCTDVRDLERKETFHTLITQLHTQKLVGISSKNVPPSD